MIYPNPDGNPKTWDYYTDQYGLIKQVWKNQPPHIGGGDSCQRTGMKAIFDWLLFVPGTKATFRHQIALLEIEPGILCRHPHGRAYETTVWSGSRDQYLSVIYAAGMMKETDFVKRIFKDVLKRGLRFRNIMHHDEPNWQKAPSEWTKGRKFGDVCWSPEHFTAFLRAMRHPLINILCYPLYLLGDLFSIGSSVVKIIEAYRNPPHKDDVSRICALLGQKHLCPTPLGWVARQLYLRFRPGYLIIKRTTGQNYIPSKYIAGPVYAMTEYFKHPWEPPFTDYNVHLKNLLR